VCNVKTGLLTVLTWLFYESIGSDVWQKCSGLYVSPCSLHLDERLVFAPQTKGSLGCVFITH